MADVEFDDVGYRDDGLNIVIVKSMPCIHLKALRVRVRCRRANALQFALALGDAIRVGIFSRVQLYYRRAKLTRGINLLHVGIDEK